MDSAPPSIEFTSVSFSFGEKSILNGLSFRIEKGQTVGIIGPSGSGKSTLLLLILGLLKPSNGQILIDGEVAWEILEKSNIKVGYVGPEPFLFAGSIRENLNYGGEELTDVELWSALHSASLSDQIQSLTNQLDHKISEGGTGLSAGQKQRLCLARVFLRKPSLIILDEATANLDLETEMNIVDSLQKMNGIATIIIVSHRQAALRFVDVTLDLGVR